MSSADAKRYVVPLAWSLIVASVFNALLVITKEESPALKDGMKALFGHHWVGHGVVVLLAFLVIGGVLSARGASPSSVFDDDRLAWAVTLATFVSGLLIAAFFLLEVGGGL